MTQTQQQIEHLRTLQESFDSLANIAEVQIPALSDKIDNIQLPEIDFTGIAQESTLQEIKNTLGVVDDKTFMAMADDEITEVLTGIWNTMI